MQNIEMAVDNGSISNKVGLHLLSKRVTKDWTTWDVASFVAEPCHFMNKSSELGILEH